MASRRLEPGNKPGPPSQVTETYIDQYTSCPPPKFDINVCPEWGGGGQNFSISRGGGGIGPLPSFPTPMIHRPTVHTATECKCNPFALSLHIWICKYTRMFSLCAYLPSTVTTVSAPNQTPPPTRSHRFSQHSEPICWPKFGQQNDDDASRDGWRHYDSRVLFMVSQGFPKPINIIYRQGFPSEAQSQFAKTMWRHPLLMLRGKKTKKTLAYVFAGANVLGRPKRDNHSIDGLVALLLVLFLSRHILSLRSLSFSLDLYSFFFCCKRLIISTCNVIVEHQKSFWLFALNLTIYRTLSHRPESQIRAVYFQVKCYIVLIGFLGHK